ncbi:hypothetical protein [Selenomonas sp. KH1T6]|nr:hypothetical protein SAMN05216583_13012 [Selenomonas ruminantium]
MEKLYVAAGVLPKREDMEAYNRREISEYNERHPDYPISLAIFEMQM